MGGFMEISKIIRERFTLEKLVLRGDVLGDVGLPLMLPILKGCHINILDFEIHPNFTAEIARELCSAAGKTSKFHIYTPHTYKVSSVFSMETKIPIKLTCADISLKMFTNALQNWANGNLEIYHILFYSLDKISIDRDEFRTFLNSLQN